MNNNKSSSGWVFFILLTTIVILSYSCATENIVQDSPVQKPQESQQSPEKSGDTSPDDTGRIFPEGEFLGDKSRPQSDRGGSADYQKLREFPNNSLDYDLGRKVAYFENSSASCTGFLVGRDLLLTSYHCVLTSESKLASPDIFRVYMEYWNDWNKGAVSSSVIRIEDANKDFDFALLRLSEPLGDEYGWLEVYDGVVEDVDAVKIIQHPRARSKEIVRKNSTVISSPKPNVIHYLADTDKGSSGAPVFPLAGDKVIAMHHADDNDYNEGILMTAIMAYINGEVEGLAMKPAPEPTPAPVSTTTSETQHNNGLSFDIRFLYSPYGSKIYLPLTNDEVLYSGDSYKIVFTPHQDCYVYIFQIDGGGNIVRLFPMRSFNGTSVNNLNPVEIAKTYHLPAKTKSFRLDALIGVEKVIFIASKTINMDLESDDDELMTSALKKQLMTTTEGYMSEIRFIHK